MKAHQRIIREQEEKMPQQIGFFGVPKQVSIQEAKVKRIDFKTASSIILKYEWLGTMPTYSTHYFGIYFDGMLGGVVIYGISLPKMVFSNLFNGKHTNKIRVLSRGACTWWAHEHAASKLISVSLKELSKEGYKAVIAYCDSRAGEIGTIYQACNFLYIGKSGGGYEYHIAGKWRTGKGASNYAHKKRDLSQYERRERSIKYKYIYLLGTKTEKKEMLEYLKNKILPYPKRNEY